ncbi:MAG TPA: ABC transporter permease, partial [Candidatus Sulfotelmatobacter sp.]|nr:ABC transporter permease [Candidatus Sulfotelmatobacter sp.]
TIRALRRRHAMRSQVILRCWQFLVLLAVLGLWQLVVSLRLVDPIIAKSPGQVFAFLRQSSASGELWRNTAATMEAVCIAFGLASVVGVTLGITLGLLRGVERVLTPFFDAANAMPRIALAPVFIVWLGIGTEAKVALAFSIVVFVVVSAAQAGVRSADPEVLRMSAVFGITKPQLFYKVLLPVSVPAIFAGLRLGLVYALLGVVGSEIIASQEGLGQLISLYSGEFKLDAVYGILIVLAVIASILNMITAAAERWLLRWRPTDP